MPKVTNGVIEDIVVVKSGKGYRDPVVFVRGGAPEDGPNHPYITSVGRRYRLWRCMNERETLAGDMEICGHIEWGLYPPENCPGEVPVDNNAEMIKDANVSEERTAEVKFNWLNDNHLIFTERHFAWFNLWIENPPDLLPIVGLITLTVMNGASIHAHPIWVCPLKAVDARVENLISNF